MRRTWQLFLGVSLVLGCNGPKTGESDTDVKAKCSTHSACSHGYKCNYGGANPSDPHAVGECDYQTCGLTDLCKKPQACLPSETASCDKFDNDKFCGCVGLNSEEVPADPTTGGTPTTGGPPPAGGKP